MGVTMLLDTVISKDAEPSTQIAGFVSTYRLAAFDGSLSSRNACTHNDTLAGKRVKVAPNTSVKRLATS